MPLFSVLVYFCSLSEAADQHFAQSEFITDCHTESATFCHFCPIHPSLSPLSLSFLPSFCSAIATPSQSPSVHSGRHSVSSESLNPLLGSSILHSVPTFILLLNQCSGYNLHPSIRNRTTSFNDTYYFGKALTIYRSKSHRNQHFVAFGALPRIWSVCFAVDIVSPIDRHHPSGVS